MEKIHTDASQPEVSKEVKQSVVRPKGAGADRKPEPNPTIDPLSYGKYSPRKGSPR
jgi:hypothetical protein